MSDPKVDRWIQRSAVAAMVAVAVTLLGVGIALYGPRAFGSDTTQVVAK